MLDEGLVEAAQTIRALEDGDEEDFYPIEQSESSPPPSSSTTKRLRDGNEEEGRREPKRITGNGGIGGILGEDAMENLRFYADMAKRQAQEDRKQPVQKKVQPKTKVGMALLGGYGSGDDSD